MYKKSIATLAICYCFAPVVSFSQDTLTATGKVQDAAGRPLAFALTALRALPDSAVVKGTYTDTLGYFIFDHLKAGPYFVEVSADGFTPYSGPSFTVKAGTPDMQIPVIAMANLPKGLKEVSITARRAFVVQKADRTVVNTDALLTAAGTTALELLEKCPGVQVDQDGNIKLKGKQGVTVYIDDRPTYLSGTELANYLKSLPSSVLDQIELMTNPPAKYDAAGSGGIINIKTKRSGVKGFNGGLNLSLTQGQLTRSNNSANINYRNNKVTAFANMSYGHDNSFTDLKLNRIYTDAGGMPMSYLEQKSYFKQHGNNIGGHAGADYRYSAKSMIGVGVSGMAGMSSRVNDNTSDLLDAVRLPDSVIIAQNKGNTDAWNGSINLNYKTEFNKSGHTLTADADHLAYRTHTSQQFHNDGFLPDGTQQSADKLDGDLPNQINIYALKTDYTLPLASKWQLAAGLKTSYTTTDNKAAYSSTVNNVTQPDYNKSNQFLYHENINAAYLNMNREGNLFSVQIGLRLEQTVSYGHQLGNALKPDSAFNRSYLNAFPTIYLSYKFDSLATHQLGLNYGRRINRPYYEDLNPFINPMDKFTYYVGNPFLNPSFTNSIELSHTYKNKITTALNYGQTLNDVNETIEIKNGIYYSRPGNIGRKSIATLSVNANVDPAKWLNLNIYSELTNIQSRSDFYNGKLKTGGTYWYLGLTIRTTPVKGWDGELNGFYRSKLYDAQFVMSELWQANLAVRKKLSNAISLKLSVNDIAYSMIVRGEITSLDQASAGWVNKRDSRCLTLTFSYNFGKAFSNTSRHESTGADTEKSRVKG